MGTEITGGGGRGRLYLTLHCHHQNDSCIKIGSDVSHFNASVIAEEQRHNQTRVHEPQPLRKSSEAK